MKNKKTGFFKKLFMSLACVFSIGLTACGGGSDPVVEDHSITWEVSEKATVQVKDMEELPTRLPEGSTLSFTVTVENGFELGNVIANNKRVNLSKGYYNVRISRDTIIKVTTEKQATGIEVTTNPTKLTYFVGDELDVTGMVVKVKYADNTSEILEKGVKGYAVSPSIFEGGETSFKVIYGKFTQEVQLAAKVEYKVEIDPAGGTIDAAWINAVTSMNLNNFNISDTGIVTFTYFDNIERPITVPTAEQITRENYTFLGWSNEVKQITNGTQANYETHATWQAELVKVTFVDLVLEENVPYLIVKGQFKLADKVTLILYEGNVQAGFEGTTMENTEGPGSEFILKYNLNELVAASTGNEDDPTFEGKWMDIKFGATIDGETKTMDINIGPDSTVTCDHTKKINSGLYTFSFHEYDNWIKVDYTVNHYVYDINFTTESGVDYLNIAGSANPKYAGKKFGVSWFFDGETPITSADIASDGKFLVKVNLTDIMMNRQGFAHAYIYDTDPTTNLLAKEGQNEVNLSIAQCQTPLTDVEIGVQTDINRAVRYKNDSGIAYYAGHGWDGLMLIKVEETFKAKYTSMDVKLVEGEVYYVVNGTYEGSTKNELAFSYDAQLHGGMSSSGWDYLINKTAVNKIDGDDTTKQFTAYAPVSELGTKFLESGSEKWVFIVHFGIKDSVGDVKDVPYARTVVNKSGVKYSLLSNQDSWGMNVLVLEKTTATDGEILLALNSAKVENIENRAILTITGTSTGYPADYISSILAVRNGVYNANNGYNFANVWEEIALTIDVKLQGNVITITADITDLDISGYTMNYKYTLDGVESGKQDLKLTSNLAENSVTINDKIYTVSEDLSALSDGNKCWGVLMLTVLAAPLA